eukprot:scaffold157971_cov47-Prasinocladus_malaysianus.AAC.1
MSRLNGLTSEFRASSYFDCGDETLSSPLLVCHSITGRASCKAGTSEMCYSTSDIIGIGAAMGGLFMLISAEQSRCNCPTYILQVFVSLIRSDALLREFIIMYVVKSLDLNP